jgi:hypothetical protein
MLNPKTMAEVERVAARYQPPIRKTTSADYNVGADAGSVWPTLEVIPDEVDAAPAAFPFEVLGPILGNAARAIAAKVQAPDSLAGGSVLASASLAVQPLANVVLPHGQRSPLSVFVITAALSGDRKSAVDAVANAEVELVRREQAREFSKAIKNYEADMASRNKKDAEPAKPTPKSLTTANATIEGLSRLLKFQSHVGVFSSEGGEMLAGHSLRDEKRPAGLAFYLKLWGGESIDSLRGGEGLSVLLNRRGAMHVLAQPVLLGQLLADPLAQGQGLLARCLIAQPDTLAGQRLFRNVNPNVDADVLIFNCAIKKLLNTLPPLWETGDNYELKPRDLPLSDEAEALWIPFYNLIEAAQADGKELEHARPFASKAAEHAARIAGIITMVENPEAKSIEGDAMDGAIQLTGFYLSEHIRLTGAGCQVSQFKHLRSLARWMQSQGLLVSKADVLQRSPFAQRKLKAKGLNLLLIELARRGYVREMGAQWEVRHVPA